MGKNRKPAPSPNGAAVVRAVLEASLPRPTVASSQSEKNQYAIRFAEHMANQIAKDLAHRLKEITATAKRTGGSVRSKKQLDVNFSTPEVGLALGISLKSVHLKDAKSLRFNHNMKRNEEELRIEAMGYHKRQPYAVMVAILFLPFDSCDDGKAKASSFGSWVRHLRPYTGRGTPEDEHDQFEKIFIGLYEGDGSDLRFFDVADAPPERGRPSTTLSYSEALDVAYRTYQERNGVGFKWASGEEDPLDVSAELEGVDEDE